MMADDRAARVRVLVSRETSLDGDRPAVAGWLQRMCRAAARDLPATGVGVSLLGEGGEIVSLAASGEASLLVEELQLVLGEGPCMDAYASRSPVLVPDVKAAAATTWPGYAAAVQEQGIRAVFAFPLQIGAARLGAMDVYRDHVGNLSDETLSQALTFADLAMETLLDAGQGSASAAGVIEDADGGGFEVYQAQGMVMIQIGGSARDALARLRAHAYAHNLGLSDVARAVIDRRLMMESDT